MSSLDAPAMGDTGVEVAEVDRAQAAKNLDRLAQRFLGITGDEFQHLRGIGVFDGDDHTPGLTRVQAAASLLD